MTGKEWSNYFQSQTEVYKLELLKALETLDNDPAFRKAYGIDFKELAYLIKYPLSK